MAEAVLTTDRGEQLVAVFTYPAAPTGTAEFVVRAKVDDPDPALIKISSADEPASADGTVTVSGSTVTVTVNGPTTMDLPRASQWALWIAPGTDAASVISGALRVYEVVQP